MLAIHIMVVIIVPSLATMQPSVYEMSAQWVDLVLGVIQTVKWANYVLITPKQGHLRWE